MYTLTGLLDKEFFWLTADFYRGGFKNTVFVGPKLGGEGGCFVSLGLTAEEEGWFARDEVWGEFVREV